MKKNNLVFFSLGSNLGDRDSFLLKAKRAISADIGVIIKESSVYESEPWGFISDEPFLNQVLKVESFLEPEEIMLTIRQIEHDCGRTGKVAGEYASRTLDIDILLMGDTVFFSNNLVIPHPRMEYRKFVLVPLAEIDPEMIHPVYQKSIQELLEECADNHSITPYQIQ